MRRTERHQPRRPRLLLVGAGETEIGRPEYGSRVPRDLRGAVLPHLLDRILGPPDGELFLKEGNRRYEIGGIIAFDRLLRIPTTESATSSSLSNMDSEKTRRVLLLAELEGFDAVVVLIDRESKRQPDRARRLREGRDAFRRTGGTATIACAVGAPCRCVETWLLVDSEARESVLGATAGNPFSGDPEDRPPPHRLKQFIAQAAGTGHLDRWDAYERLARESRPEEIRARCTTSYPPFANDVETEIRCLV